MLFYNKNSKNQSGAVSIFIVIFVTLLVVIVTTSFIKIMLNDQQQATNSDLSQSAYDSAQAGVEDVKRAYMNYRKFCSSTTGSDPGACAAITATLLNQSCNKFTNMAINNINSSNEQKLQSSTDADDESKSFEQAYTCTKVRLNTPDYLGKLDEDKSIVIPLRGVGAFDTVKIEWFSQKDLSSGTSVSIPSGSDVSLPIKSEATWPANRPPIFRSQLIKFDTSNVSDLKNSKTLFLYPSTTGVSTGFGDDLLWSSVTSTKSPKRAKCVTSTSAGSAYFCSSTVNLGSVIPANSDTAYLRLTALYNKANYRVSLSMGSTNTEFKEVQPEVDSTGRANTLFRRVKSRIELVDTNFPYPEAAVDISGNLCKDFIITDDTADYSHPCTP